MILILYSELNDKTIKSNLGRPQYSYFFLLKSFREALSKIGEVIIVDRPHEQVDKIYNEAKTSGKKCVFLSFTPPNLVPLNLNCPTVCLFAWEFSTVPEASWDHNPGNNWVWVFQQLAGVIATSSDTAKVVSEALHRHGINTPVLSIPTPTWEEVDSLRAKDPLAHILRGSVLNAPGYLQDTQQIDFDLRNLLPRYFAEPKSWPTNTAACESEISANSFSSLLQKHFSNWYREISGNSTYQAENSYTEKPISDSSVEEAHEVELNGVIYTTVLNPEDGRKRHLDLMTAFVWSFKDNPDVTLVMKLTQRDTDKYSLALNHTLHQLYPFKCRIVIFNGYLSDKEYQDLISASTFYVNTSYCEGLCIPLMEFLSAGKLAIAPRHTAMEDYINDDVAFIVESSLETNVWPQDPRGKYTTKRYRNNWETIVTAFDNSYQMVTQRPNEYLKRSDMAKSQMKNFCSLDSVTAKLDKFLSDDLELPK